MEARSLPYPARSLRADEILAKAARETRAGSGARLESCGSLDVALLPALGVDASLEGSDLTVVLGCRWQQAPVSIVAAMVTRPRRPVAAHRRPVQPSPTAPATSVSLVPL